MKTVLINPIIYADVPDVDVIRVNDAYYMVSTTMHMIPGCPIMKSKDLAHWEIIGYVFDKISDDPRSNLENGQHMYGSNQWAACLRRFDDKFYVCFNCGNMDASFIFYTDDIESSNWNRIKIDEIMHDPALIRDGDTPYVISGCGDIRILELEKDFSKVKEGGVDKILFSTQKEGISLRCEGAHAYKIGEYFYILFIEWPIKTEECHGRRRVVCYRSKELLGEYERKILFDDNMGYLNKGIAQGALFDTPEGDWYAMLFQDHDAVGRIPYILPVKWEDDWPVIGVDGKTPRSIEVPYEKYDAKPIVISDDFNYEENKLALQWQWNHNPDNDNWSVIENPGHLRLRTGHITHCVVNARNTLTQRTIGPKCEVSTVVDVSNMKDGDSAGLVALQSRFATVGVKVLDGKTFICMSIRDGFGEYITEKVETALTKVYLKMEFNFENSRDVANFFYSKDGVEYIMIGTKLKMLYTLDHFMGYRAGLFNYATKEIGGYVDFDYFDIKAV